MMAPITELIKEVYDEHKTSTERIKLVRLAINTLYNHFDCLDDNLNEKLKEQYESFLTDPRRI
jgi:hypothetical protein